MSASKTGEAQRAGNNTGFTLIEVLIALAIFSIGFLSVGFMQISGLNKTSKSREITEAMTIAETRVESLMSMDFYLDHNKVDDDHNGMVDFYDLNPDLAAGTYQDDAFGSEKFKVSWDIIDNVPLPAVDGPAPFPVTRSKTITLWVSPEDKPNDVLIEIQFVKVGIARG